MIDRQISEWPDLLHLYSRLKPGITVLDWMREHDVHNKYGIDPRRFVSFGVIKVGRHRSSRTFVRYSDVCKGFPTSSTPLAIPLPGKRREVPDDRSKKREISVYWYWFFEPDY